MRTPKARIYTISNTAVRYRTTIFFELRRWMFSCFSSIKSYANTNAIAKNAIASVLVSRNGIPGSVNIFLKIVITSPRSLTRKNTQAKLTMVKVSIKRRRFAIENLSEICLIFSPYTNRSITIQAPCMAPHIIKV